MRAARIVRRVRLLADPLIPGVAVAVECSHAVAIDPDIIASKNKRS